MCNSLGGDLAVIHNEKLMNVMIEHTQEDGWASTHGWHDTWIGLKKDEQGDGENDIVLIDSNLECQPHTLIPYLQLALIIKCHFRLF